MEKIIETIKVNASVNAIYDQWSKVEDFPRFMRHIESVERIDNARLHWKAEVGGKAVEWDSEVVEQVPNERISWRSISGHRHAGTVEFRPLSEQKTEVILVMAYEPEGLLEHIGDALGVTSRRVMLDLASFKAFMESRAQGSGRRATRDETRTGYPGL